MIIETSRLRLAVERRGSGEPVVLLHSLAMAGAMWEHVAERLAKRFEVWTYDARGHGQSPWDNEPFTIEDLAEDLRDLLDALGLDRAHIVGLSMGGTTAIVFAATYPERVNRLVLVDCSACYGPTRVSDWEARASKVLSSPREALLDFQLDRWFTPHFRATNPEEVRRQVEIFLACSSHVHAAASRALAAVDAEVLEQVPARLMAEAEVPSRAVPESAMEGRVLVVPVAEAEARLLVVLVAAGIVRATVAI